MSVIGQNGHVCGFIPEVDLCILADKSGHNYHI